MSIRTALTTCVLTLAACNSGTSALSESPSTTSTDSRGPDNEVTTQASGSSSTTPGGSTGSGSEPGTATTSSPETTTTVVPATSGESGDGGTVATDTGTTTETATTSEAASTTTTTTTQSEGTGVASSSDTAATTSMSTATDSTATDSTATDRTATDRTATDSTATDSTATDGTATDGTATDGTTTGGETEPVCPLDCTPPCDLVLSPGPDAVRSVHHDGAHFVARDVLGRLVLRDAATLEVVHLEHETTWAQLVSGVLAVGYVDGSVVLRASADLGVLGEVVAGPERGLAIDGGYLWSIGTEGIEVFAVDGSPIWSTDGDFSQAQVLALTDSLHVFSDAHASDAVMHVDLEAHEITETTFGGVFAGWFGDAPRYWSQHGMAYRLYEADGTELAFDLGSIVHGWGDHVVVNGTVAHVSDLGTPLLSGVSGSLRRSGPALAVYGETSTIVVLDPAGPQQQVFPPPSFPPVGPSSWRFAWSPLGWVIGRGDAIVADQLDRATSIGPPSLGPITWVDAAINGRFALTQPNLSTTIWDVVPDCTVEPVGALDLPWGPLELSPDGSVLAHSLPSPSLLDNLHGSHLHALPSGEEIGYFGSSGCSTCVIRRWAMSDDASIVAHIWSWAPAWGSRVFQVPSGTVLGGDDSNVLPAIAPDGVHIVVTDSQWGESATYEDALAYVYDDGVFADVFDGVAWGFIDNQHLLLSHYAGADSCSDAGVCDTFLHTDIVTLDGTVVQATILPDVREFQRISDTEIFVTDPPRIFDVYSGELLWSMPDVASAGAISPNLVVWTDTAELVVHRWR